MKPVFRQGTEKRRSTTLRDWSTSMGGVGRSREGGGGHEVLSLVQGVGPAIFSCPWGVGHPIVLRR